MKKEHLYIKPFITAGAFLLAGIILLAGGFIQSGDPNMNQYALVAFGLLFLIVAAVIFAMYGVMEKRYRSLFRDGPLLRFALPKDSHRMQAEKNIAQLRMKNKALLMVMLFFCALFAVILPFFVEEKLLMAGICLGLGAFLALAAWLITSYRVRKIRRSGDEVILGRGGAFLNGSFHAWNMPGAGITDLAYEPPGGKQEPGELRIEYAAGIHPAPVTETLILQIPAELEDKIPRVLQALEEGRGH
ncbi:MAG: hypothetical protein GX124_02785 [Clostridiales bacterium]|nr:hypothetical protein [Clostridiales bacterium]